MFSGKDYRVIAKLTVPPSSPRVAAADTDPNNADLYAMLAQKPAVSGNTFSVLRGMGLLLATGCHTDEKGQIRLFRPGGCGTHRPLGAIVPRAGKRLVAAIADEPAQRCKGQFLRPDGKQVAELIAYAAIENIALASHALHASRIKAVRPVFHPACPWPAPPGTARAPPVLARHRQTAPRARHSCSCASGVAASP